MSLALSNRAEPRQSGFILLTFAVTLSLLLSISLGILARNMTLRYRESRIRRAVARGLLPPEYLGWVFRDPLGGMATGAAAFGAAAGVTGRRGVKIVGPRPILWDAWVEEGVREKSHDKWGSIAPLSIAPLTQAVLAPAPSPAHPTPSPPIETPQRSLLEVIFRLPPMPHIPRTPPEGTSPPFAPVSTTSPRPTWAQRFGLMPPSAVVVTPAAPVVGTPTEEQEKVEKAMREAKGVRVAVLVAMPRDRRAANANTRRQDDESGLEGVDVAVGTSDVRWPSSLSSAFASGTNNLNGASTS